MPTRDKPPPRGVTKATLIDAVYDQHGGITKSEAAEIVDAIFGTVKTSLGGGRAVKIKNFGVFDVKRRAARRGVNPKSGRRIDIPEHTGLHFRASSHLRSDLEVDD